jgi:hypothetical protein
MTSFWLRLMRLLDLHEPEPELPVVVPTWSLGGVMVTVAKLELGRGEGGANNIGPDVEKYRFGKVSRGAWCAWFLSWVMAEACRRINIPEPVPRTGGAKRFWKAAGRAGLFDTAPEVGDICCWHRGAHGSWKGHVGIVSRLDENRPDTFWSIEGNRGRWPSVVAEYRHELGEARLKSKFARLPQH